ncbi:MAG TPA: serine/threonine-protein kinase [Candidatus Acidoferrum sp.]|nr:serine/threonine-protein kinase [Candidatus Acidoferrum sp.]
METATKAGRYEILEELGRGAMGVVYRAKDPLIGRVVATKTIQISEEGTGMSRAQLVELFQTEARAAGRLTHPNIVVIYDVGECDGAYYITMELLKGKSLQSLLEAGEKFPITRLLRIAEQICSALEFAHHHGVVHRDIKPANIMLTNDDLVKITDFGTAKILESGASQRAAAMGTPSYMAPEQIKGKAVDGRTDIFSFGVMLYEMTTGQKPFRGQDVATVLHQILNEEPPPPHQLNPSIPTGVSSAILKAMTKSPYLRYENCNDLLEDLKHYRPGVVRNDSNAERTAIRTPSPKHAAPEKPDKKYQAETPKVPGVEARHAPSASSYALPAAHSKATAEDDSRVETERPPVDVYAGPTTTKTDFGGLKRVATIAGGVLLALMLSSFAIKAIKGRRQPDVAALLAQNNDPATPQSPTPEAAERPPYVTESNREIATIGNLAKPWSSKKFFYRSLTLSKDVPAMIVRLPGPASERRSYWAFSLEAPFAQCQFEYVEDMAKLSSDYGFKASHPMVVNPCSQAVFDPLQLKALPGNIFVRGAVVRGYDLRPPFGIDLQISGNQIRAMAME